MKIRIRFVAAALALAAPVWAQDAQIPRRLERQLQAEAEVAAAAAETPSLDARERELEADLERKVSARVAAVLSRPARLGAVADRSATATAASMRGVRRVLYAAN